MCCRHMASQVGESGACELTELASERLMQRLCGRCVQQGLMLFVPCAVNHLQQRCEMGPVNCPYYVIPVQVVETAAQGVLQSAAGMKQQTKRMFKAMDVKYSCIGVMS